MLHGFLRSTGIVQNLPSSMVISTSDCISSVMAQELGSGTVPTLIARPLSNTGQDSLRTSVEHVSPSRRFARGCHGMLPCSVNLTQFNEGTSQVIWL